jgi:hypothetical protein
VYPFQTTNALLVPGGLNQLNQQTVRIAQKDPLRLSPKAINKGTRFAAEGDALD